MERRRKPPKSEQNDHDKSRREFLKKFGLGIAGAALMPSELLKNEQHQQSDHVGHVEVGEMGPVPDEYEEHQEIAELLTEGVLWPKIEAYIREEAFMHPESTRNIVAEIIKDQDPRSDVNLMARMMFSEDNEHPVVAAMIGYVAKNRLRNAHHNKFQYTLQDVVCGYGQDAFGKQDGSRPFASDQDVLDDSMNVAEVLENTSVNSHDFFEKKGGSEQSDFEKTIEVVRSNRKLLYRVLARMIQDPSQPLEKLYNFGQTLFMHVDTQKQLHGLGKVKSPEQKEHEFATRLGAVKLRLPLDGYNKDGVDEYIAFYTITNPRDPFSTDYEIYLATNEFVDKDFLAAEAS